MTPPRLYVLTAVDCAAAVVLRRGPPNAVGTIGWDRDSHAFAPGQWLRGSLYEHRADLSPDGRHMVHFASPGGGQAWTAVSRAPWLRAVLFRLQDRTWGGDGAFEERGRLWLNGVATPADLPDRLKPAPHDAYPHSTDGFHMGGTYPVMLEGRGLQRQEGESYAARLARGLPGGRRIELSFALHAPNRAIISNRYALVPARGERLEKPDWEWAEPWGDRLQFAARGALWDMPAEARALEARRLHDFTGMAFEPVAASYEGVVA